MKTYNIAYQFLQVEIISRGLNNKPIMASVSYMYNSRLVDETMIIIYGLLKSKQFSLHVFYFIPACVHTLLVVDERVHNVYYVVHKAWIHVLRDRA